MQIALQDLMNFDFCPWYYTAGGIKKSTFSSILEPIIQSTILRYWATRLQRGGPFQIDVPFTARAVFAERMMQPPEDVLKYLLSVIRISERMVYRSVYVAGAELTASIDKDTTVPIDVPIIFDDSKGNRTAVYHPISVDNINRKAPSIYVARHGFIPNLLFLVEEVRIDRVLLVYADRTLEITRTNLHVDNAKARFQYIATGIKEGIRYKRFGSWCKTCPLSSNEKCGILR